MEMEREIITENGIPVSYWYLVQLNLNFVDGRMNAIVAGYVNESFKLLGKDAAVIEDLTLPIPQVLGEETIRNSLMAGLDTHLTTKYPEAP